MKREATVRSPAPSLVAATGSERSPEPAMGVSHCHYAEPLRRLSLRGWVSDPRLTRTIALYGPRGESLGATRLSEKRLDVARKYGQDDDATLGFNFDLEATVLEGDRLSIVALAENEEPLARTSATVALLQPFAFETVAYDTAAKLLEIEGYVVPAKQMRGMNVLFSRGRAEPVPKVFVHRPDVSRKHPAIANHYTGFKTKIHHIGQGDLMQARLSIEYVDGTNQLLEIPADSIRYNVTRASVTELVIDWLNDTFRITGWYRSFETVTHAEIRIAGQLCYGFVAVKQNNQIAEQQKLVGVPAYEFHIEGSIDQLFDNPQLLLDASAGEAELKLYSKAALVHVARLEPDKKYIRNTSIDLAIFDRRNSTLILKGRYAAIVGPSVGNVTLNGTSVGRSKEVVSSVNDPAASVAEGTWTWAHDVNGAISAGSTITIELSDVAGRNLGSASIRGSKLIMVDGVNALGGMEAPNLAAVYSRWNLSTIDRLPDNAVLFAYQGSVAGGYGGALTRMIQLMRTLKASGFTIALVDRTAAWEIGAEAKRYAELMSVVDFHFMLPTALCAPMLGQAITTAQERAPTEGFALELFNKMKTLHKSPPPSVPHQRTILDRADPYFNLLSTFIANAMKPRIFVSTYVWSSEAHRHLDPSIVGFLDLIDLQFDRLRIFTEARERFGEGAVPVLEKFSVDREKEIAAINVAKHVIAISSEEHAQLVPSIGAHRLFTLGMGVEQPNVLRRGDVAPRILFVGNDYEPNVFSVQKFIDEQFDRIRSSAPDAELIVVGSVCGKLNAAKDGVVLVDKVPRVEDYYARAAVVVNPVLFGSGISIKTIEALGHGLATVCTPEGARGLPGLSAHGAAVVAPFDRLAEEIIRLLGDDDARLDLEERALAYAREQLSPDLITSDLLNFIETKLFYP